MSPFEADNARVFLVDLTGATMLRFSCEADETMYLIRATTPSDDSIDGPWEAFSLLDGGTPVNPSASRATTAAGDLEWLTIPEVERIEQKLGIGHSANDVSLNPNTLDGPFSFAVQVI